MKSKMILKFGLYQLRGQIGFGYSIGSMQEEETRDKAKIILCDSFKERS